MRRNIREVLEQKLSDPDRNFWEELSEEGKKSVERILDDSLSKEERIRAADKLAEEVERKTKTELGDKYWRGVWTANLYNFLTEIRSIKCRTLSGIDYLDQDIKALSQSKRISDELKSYFSNPKNLIGVKALLDKDLRNEYLFLCGIWKNDPFRCICHPCQEA